MNKKKASQIKTSVISKQYAISYVELERVMNLPLNTHIVSLNMISDNTIILNVKTFNKIEDDRWWRQLKEKTV